MANQPISERRLAANRANAQKSTGPRTAEGKLRVSQNATRHNLYSGPHHLPEDIEARLYHQALQQTADIANPKFRSLSVHRLILRGHERRLFQLEGKLWAEALRANNEAIPQAALWIRENQGEVVQALGRYHAWICVRIRAIQKSAFPYLTGDVAHQQSIPARVQALFAAAAGSTRPIALTAQASATPTNSVTAEDQAPASGNSNLVPPPLGLQLLAKVQGACRPVRPVPAPQPVKAIRPPTAPGLSLRFLKHARKPAPSNEANQAREANRAAANGAAANGAASVNERITTQNSPTSHPPVPPVPTEPRNPEHPDTTAAPAPTPANRAASVNERAATRSPQPSLHQGLTPNLISSPASTASTPESTLPEASNPTPNPSPVPTAAATQPIHHHIQSRGPRPAPQSRPPERSKPPQPTQPLNADPSSGETKPRLRPSPALPLPDS
ncbi:hypothetical protein [Paludibaculum fermentans]|uniref:Uncharacterized protein n=1 Tax=Paludibaculum fermentans TaxID=1473598 RepID=A0A7S7NPC3_PALFE|nr:hypothetical protein [Paludibaculum fermentans]QOY86804.1 hypothetical protein IRI77_29075 [Paludibaculum fermentans]